MSATVTVRLLHTPLRLYERAEEYNAELMREFALVAAGQHQPGHADVPGRLLELVRELGERYAHAVAQPDAQRQAATKAGLASADLIYEVPPSVGEDAALLGEMLDRAQEYCLSGHLITLAAPEEVLAFQSWYTGEFVRQTAGEAPGPWAGRRD